MRSILSVIMLIVLVMSDSNTLEALPVHATPVSPHTGDYDRAQQSGQYQTSLTGKKVLVTYRNGGPIYGTYYFLEVHFCTTTYYQLFGQSRKQTIMDNEQVYNWQEGGRWKVIRNQGVTSIHFQSTSGANYFIPLYSSFYSVQVQGRATCRYQ